MKNICVFLGLSIFIFFAFHSKAAASDVIISGSVQFDTSLSGKYMEKHGYVFIEESFYKNYITTNIYGLKDADVLIKDEYGKVLGIAITDEKGKFSVSVPNGELYKIIVRFHDNEVIKQVEFPKIDNVVVYAGFFSSDVVDIWIAEAYRSISVSAKDPADRTPVRTSFSRSYQ